MYESAYARVWRIIQVVRKNKSMWVGIRINTQGCENDEGALPWKHWKHDCTRNI